MADNTPKLVEVVPEWSDRTVHVYTEEDGVYSSICNMATRRSMDSNPLQGNEDDVTCSHCQIAIDQIQE